MKNKKHWKNVRCFLNLTTMVYTKILTLFYKFIKFLTKDSESKPLKGMLVRLASEKSPSGTGGARLAGYQ